MRHSALLVSVLVVFANFANPAHSQSFVRHLDDETSRRVAEYNDRFVAELAFLSKRYQIVEIDYKLTREAKIADVEFFPGEPTLTFLRSDMRTSQIEGAATWIGEVDSPLHKALDAGVLAAENGLDQETADQLYKALNRVELLVLYWDIDVQTGEAFPSAEQRDQSVGPIPKANATDNAVKKFAFATISGDINLSAIGKGVYRVEPMKYSPRYHIVYELDPSKQRFTQTNENSAPPAKEFSDDTNPKTDFDVFREGLELEPNRLVTGELL